MKRILVLLMLVMVAGQGFAGSTLLPYCPVGEIKMLYSGIATAPGFLLCDGSTFSATTYPELFAAIATTTLPNFQGVFPKGMGSQTIGGVVYNGAGANPIADKTQGHIHLGAYNTPGATVVGRYGYVDTGSDGGRYEMNDAGNGFTTAPKLSGPYSDGTNGTPRTGTITEPANVGVKFWIKY